jgi:tetratricopeptide (TPR) repeat protein
MYSSKRDSSKIDSGKTPSLWHKTNARADARKVSRQTRPGLTSMRQCRLVRHDAMNDRFLRRQNLVKSRGFMRFMHLLKSSAFILFVLITTRATWGVDDPYQLGQQAWSSKHYSEAIADFNRALKLNPRSLPAMLARAQCYRDENQLDQAFDSFTQALALDPKNPAALAGRGEIYLIKQQYQKGIADLSKAIQIAPNGLWYYEMRYAAYQSTHQFKLAIKDISKMLELTNKSDVKRQVVGYCSRGECYMALNDYQQALVDHNKAVALDPKREDTLLCRGKNYLALHMTNKAMQDYDKAISLNPKSAAYAYRAELFQSSGQTEKSIEDYTSHLRDYPGDAGAWYQRGVCYMRLGKIEAALSDFRQTAKITGNFEHPILDILVDKFLPYLEKYEQKGDYKQAVKLCTSALEIFPNQKLFYKLRAYDYYRLNQYQLAIADCDKVISLVPDYTEAYETRGNLYFKLGQYPKAIADYNVAIRTDPNLVGIYQRRGASFLALGDYELAVKDFTRIIDLQPDSWETYRQRAQAYEKLGRHNLAQSDLRKAGGAANKNLN